MLTKRQKQALDFIKLYTLKKGVAPSLEEIKENLGLSSVSTAHHHVQALKDRGYLGRLENQPRAINVFEEEQMVQIPLLGAIAAGRPLEVFEQPETLAIPKINLGQTGDFFALRVTGDSMVDEEIRDGDIVIVKKQSTAHNGQRVVALIENTEATLKKFFLEHGRVRLQPANKKCDPIIVKRGDFSIQGVVVDVIKKEQDLTELILTLPKKNQIEKKPKGGCELTYLGKLDERAILNETPRAKLLLERKAGTADHNKLIQGDNLHVLKTLSEDPTIRGKIDLVYIDPPYGTGQDFVGYDESNSYSDQLVNADFLEFLRRRLIFLHELLAEQGSIFVHIDLKIGHYIKILMDEIFGEENFRNDITRIKCNPKNFDRKAFGNVKDVIYFYSKSKPNGNDPMLWNDYRVPLTEKEITQQFPKIDKRGQRYATTPLHAKGETRNGPTGRPWKGLSPPKGRHWRYGPQELSRLDKSGMIEWSSTGNPRKIIYPEENRGKKIQDVWDFRDPGYETSLYPTEKNLDLLKQIILASSPKGGLVLDCFAGAGTTLIAAQELQRKWIGIDSNPAAVRTIERRFLTLNSKVSLFEEPLTYGVYKAIYND